MRSWQTTVAGLGCIGAGAYLITRGGAEAIVQGSALIMAGIGLVRAKDISDHSTVAEVQTSSTKAQAEAIKAANQ